MLSDEIKACFFDVFGTVVDWRTSIAGEMEAFATARGLDLDPGDFALRWRAKYDPSMATIRKGDRGYVKLDVLHRENLVDVFQDLGIEGISDADLDHLNHAWHRLAAWPDSVPGMTRLRTRYILASMSNGNIKLMVDMAKNAGLPWDMILGSEIAKNYKPHPDTYLAGTAALDLEPAQVLMVAAHNSDLIAAQKLGFKTAFIPRPTEYGPAQSRDWKADGDYEFVAESMEALADQLGCAK